MKTLLPLIASMGLLAGCATNPFAQFYQDNTKQWPITMQQRLLPPSSEPQIVSSANIQEDARRLEERGFVPIGFAGFRGGLAGQQQLRQQAKKVGADVVLYSSQFSHTEAGVIPWLSYQPGQTYITHSYGTATANAYGSGGYAYGSGTYSGYSTTTTSGTYSTQYIPYQRQVFDQSAVFWRRMKQGIFGARFTPLPEELRTKLQRNTGVLVDLVIEDGAAFKANVMRGDVITQMAGKPVTTVEELIDQLQSYAGQKVSFTIIRDGQTREIQVQLNER